MDGGCYWKWLEFLSSDDEGPSPGRVIKLCTVENSLITLSADHSVHCVNLDKAEGHRKFRKVADVSATDIAASGKHVYYVDTCGQVIRCDANSWESREEIIIKEDAKNCSHGHKTPSHKVRIKAVSAGQFGVLYVTVCGQLWASGRMPQLDIDSAQPHKVLFFEGRSVYRAAIGDNFGVVVVRKSISDEETDSENDEDVFASTCSECQAVTRLSSPASQLSLPETCPLGLGVGGALAGGRGAPGNQSSDETSSTSAPHSHSNQGDPQTHTEDTSSSTEDSELTKIHFDESKKHDETSSKTSKDEKVDKLESGEEESDNSNIKADVNEDDKKNMIFINTEAAKQFLTKQLSWVSAGEDYLVECTEKPTRIIKENVSNLTNLVVEGVKTVGDKVATLSRHMSASSDNNEAAEAYESLIAEEFNPMMYSLASNYKLDDILKSSSTVSDKEVSLNIIQDKANVLVKISHSLLNSEVWVWGDVNQGQLGTGDTIKRSQPTQVSRLNNLGVHKVVCGRSHCAALTLDGRVFTWGHNLFHQVSTDTKNDVSSPRQFSANSNTDRIRDLSCGDNHTTVFTLDGNLYYFGKHDTGSTDVVQNLKDTIKEPKRGESSDKVHHPRLIPRKHNKKSRDFYSHLSEDLNFSSRILSSGNFTYFYPYPIRQQETPALQDLAIEQQFLEEMFLVQKSLVKPLLKKTASFTADSVVYETLCSAYSDIVNFTALNVLSFWRYTEGNRKAIEIAFIQYCDEHISLYKKYMHAICDVICISGFSHISAQLEVSGALQNLFNDRLPTNRQKNNKKTSEGIVACALMHPLSRLNTYKCIIQSLIRYNSSSNLPPEVKSFMEQRLVDVLSKWDSLNDKQDKKKREADVTKLFWESSGKVLDNYRTPTRRLIRESRSHSLSLLHSGRFSSHWFILLSDVLLHLNGSNQNVHPLTTLWVEPITDTDTLQNAILIITPEETFTVTTPNSQEKTEWLHSLQFAIKVSLNKGVNAQMPSVRSATYTYTNKSQLYKDAKYSGRWLNGKLHGSGKIEWADGKTYLGQFQNNQIHGHGRMETPNIGVYEGQWKDNLQNGFGVMKYCSGDIYEGYFKDGLAHGHGVRRQGDFTTSTATIYMGDWVQGVKQGYGVIDDIGKGEKYLGLWSDNKKNGCGLIVTLDGIYYEGVFLNDTLTGHGVMVFEDGTHYEGEFRSAGVFSGKGVLTFSSGDCIEGTLSGAWTEGVKINAGTLHMNVSNPALPPNSKPNSFGKLCVPPNQKWNGLFRQCFQQLGASENHLPPADNFYNNRSSGTSFTNKKIWQNVAVLLSNVQNESVSKSSLSMEMSYRSDNKALTESLDVIPQFGQDSLTLESYNEIKQYLSKACESPAHPLGQLVSGCAAAFSASYGGVRVHPLLLSHAVTELSCLILRLYSAIRLLFPALPPHGEHFILGDGDNEEDSESGEPVSVSGIVQPLLLPRVHASLHVLYALHHQREDVAYWKRLLKWNRQTDVTLMAFLGIDQKFWVGYTTRMANAAPPYSPIKDQLFSEAVDTLQQLKTTFSPMEKLLVIRSTFRQMTAAVQKELGPNYLWTMDELFPVFHFVVVRARILQLGSEVHFMEDFLEPCMQNGELGIMFTTLKACYFQILQEKVTICE